MPVNSEETPEDKPEETPEGTPGETPDKTPAETPAETPDKTPEEVVADSSETKPDKGTEPAPDEKSATEAETKATEPDSKTGTKPVSESKASPDLKPSDPGKANNQSAKPAIIAGTGILVLILLVVGVLFATGVLGDSDSDELSDGQVALVTDVPDGAGEISQEDFDAAFAQTWKGGGLKEAPAKDDPVYDQVREAAINSVLDQAWLAGEAEEQGVTASEEDIDKELASIKKEQFSADGAYEKFLKQSGLSEDQVLDQVKLQVLSTKIQDKISGDAKPAEQQKLMADFTTDYQKRWTARTTCADDFMVVRCSNAPDESEGTTGDTGDTTASTDSADSVPTGEIDDLDAKPPIEASDDPAPTELEVEDIIEGDGDEAKKGDQVSVQYVGALYDDGTEFDSSWDRGAEPFEFKLGSGSVIKGWDQGLEGMKVGGRRKLTIPADLGYGAAGSPPSIPADATLVFIVDLKSVN